MMTRVIATHPPVELVDQRDDHTRVYEVVREIEITHHDGAKKVQLARSHIVEKASGLCYRNGSGNFVPSVPEWGGAAGGFAVDRCPYQLRAGSTLKSPLCYVTGGHEMRLRPAYLMVSDGVRSDHLAQLNPDAEGQILAGDPSRLVFRDAFGPGLDLEYAVEKAGFHQNLVFSAPPALPEDYAPETTEVWLYTEINLDEYLAVSGLDGRVNGEKIDTSRGGLASMVSTYGSVSFTEPVEDPEELPNLINAFTLSRVLDSPVAGEGRKETCAQKQLLRDGETSVSYLVESVPFSYFAGHHAPTYPVIWDFESISGPIDGGEWIPKNTYYVTGTVYVQGGLVIRPGTTVKFAQSKKLHVVSPNGYIHAKGEPYNYITFTSWKDDLSGEDLTPGQQTYGAPGDYSSAILIENGTPSCSHIAYCKIGYADSGLRVYGHLALPISHNIIRDYSNVGILHSGPGVWSNTIHNNLLAISQYYSGTRTGISLSNCVSCLVSNNTITGLGGLYHLQGVRIESTPSGYHDIRDNLVTYALWGIVGNYDYYSKKNAFFSTPGGDLINPANPSDPERKIDLYADPYASSQSWDLAGECFIDFSGEGAKLRDTGSRQADADPRLDGDEFSQVPPNEVEGGEHGDPEQWSPITTSQPYPSKDTGMVDVGYHHNRIDRYLLDTASFNGQEASLDVTPGTVVAFGADPRTSDIELRFENEAKLRCDGDPAHGGYNLFTRRDSVSMFIESPWYLNQYSAELKLKDGVDDESTITFCRFRGSTSLTLDGSSIDRPIKSNIFSLTFWALTAMNNADVEISNSLFYWNYGGSTLYYGASAQIYNNTMDENYYAAYFDLSSVNTCHFHDNLLSNNDHGIYASVSDGGELVEEFNAFYGNDYTYVLNGQQGQTDWNDILLTSCPYGSGNRGYNVDWVLYTAGRAVDGGSVSSCDAGLRIYSTRLDGSRDVGQVDIGYHHPFDESVVFVDPIYGDDGAEGTYRTPLNTIQEALTKGEADFTISVAPGTDEYPWQAELWLKESVKLYGSGARSTAIKSQPAPQSSLDEVHPFLVIKGEGEDPPPIGNIEIEGLTIRERDNEDFDGDEGLGGALHCYNSHDIAIRHCTITVNYADYGAGVYIKGSHVVVENCLIHDNLAASGVRGGGLYIEGGYPSHKPSRWPEIKNCIISANTAGDSYDPGTDAGAGICVVGSRPTIVDCIIANNVAIDQEDPDKPLYPAGGLFLEAAGIEQSPVVMDRCAVVNNIARYGGGICCEYEGQSGSHIRIADTTISNNLAIYPDEKGGGIFCKGVDPSVASSIQMTRCIVAENKAGTEEVPGEGGGLFCLDYFSVDLSSCLFAANRAKKGAGIYLNTGYAGSSANIINCSIAYNGAPALVSNQGLGIHNESPSWWDPCVVNCIIWGHELRDLFNCSPGFVTYCDIENTSQGGTGCIHQYPWFSITAFGPYHLSFPTYPQSPCIDAGSNDAPGLPQSDIDVEPRILYGGTGQYRADMGSDEVYPFKLGLQIEKTNDPTNATYTIELTWNSEYHCPYEIYRSDEAFRDDMTWEKVAEKDGGVGNTTSWSEDIPNGDSVRHRFYKVRDVSNPDPYLDISTDAVGFINVPIAPKGNESLTAMPLTAEEDGINEGVGVMLGERLTPKPDYYDNPHKLYMWVWNDVDRKYDKKELWWKTPGKWVIGPYGDDPDDKYVVKRGGAMKLWVRGWENSAPPVVTLLGYVPMERYTAFWIRLDGLGYEERPWSYPYPSKTTLNQIPFLALGAKASSNPGAADRIKVLRLGETQYDVLYLGEDGVWLNLSDGEPAAYDLVEVCPGKGFLYEVISHGDIAQSDRRYYVAKRPYFTGQ